MKRVIVAIILSVITFMAGISPVSAQPPPPDGDNNLGEYPYLETNVPGSELTLTQGEFFLLEVTCHFRGERMEYPVEAGMRVVDERFPIGVGFHPGCNLRNLDDNEFEQGDYFIHTGHMNRTISFETPINTTEVGSTSYGIRAGRTLDLNPVDQDEDVPLLQDLSGLVVGPTDRGEAIFELTINVVEPSPVDTVDPTVSHSGIPGIIHQGEAFTFTYECADNVEITGCSAWLAGKELKDPMVDTSNLAPGTHIIVLYAVDSSGNSFVMPVQFIVSTECNRTIDAAFHSHADIARTYMATFLRNPDQTGFEYWIDVASDHSMVEISGWFMQSKEWQDRYGSLSQKDFLELLYNNVLCRPSDPTGKAYWSGKMDQGMTRAEVLYYFSQSAEFENRTETVGLNSFA